MLKKNLGQRVTLGYKCVMWSSRGNTDACWCFQRRSTEETTSLISLTTRSPCRYKYCNCLSLQSLDWEAHTYLHMPHSNTHTYTHAQHWTAGSVKQAKKHAADALKVHDKSLSNYGWLMEKTCFAKCNSNMKVRKRDALKKKGSHVCDVAVRVVSWVM